MRIRGRPGCVLMRSLASPSAGCGTTRPSPPGPTSTAAPASREGYVTWSTGVTGRLDTLAFAAHQVLRDHGLRPGVDIGLMGFDDTDFAQVFGLTSLHQPLAEIAQTLLLYLARAESGADAPSHGVVLDPLFIPRDSTNRSPSAQESATTYTAGNRTNDGDSP